MYVCVCVCACACVGREGGRGGRREKGLSSAASPQDSPNLLVCTLAVMDILPRFTCRRRPFSGVPSHSVRERKKSSRTSLDLWKTQAYGTTDVRTCLFRDEKTQLETTWTSEIWLRPCVGAIEKLQTPPSPDVSWNEIRRKSGKVSWSWKKERKSLLVVLREEDFNMVMYDTQNQAARCCVDRWVTWLGVFRIVMRIMRTSRGPLAVSLEWFTTSQLQ